MSLEWQQRYAVPSRQTDRRDFSSIKQQSFMRGLHYVLRISYSNSVTKTTGAIQDTKYGSWR